MILVTIGTSEPFDRLLRALDNLSSEEELIVQAGRSSVRPVAARCVDFLEFDELVEQVRRARVVVTHAGAGTVLMVLANGKVPVVVPRLARFGEAVDDHQVPFGRRFAEQGLVVLVEDPDGLREAIARADGTAPVKPLAPDGQLAHELRGYFAEQIGPPAERDAAAMRVEAESR